MASVTIGLDVGGTTVAGGLVGADGTIVKVVKRPTSIGGERERGLQVAIEVAHRLVAAARDLGLQVDGIGAGFPEFVDLRGTLTSRDVLDWSTQPAVLLGELAPVAIESDVRCGAIGEAVFGRGRDLASFAYVSIGSGLSFTFVEGGRPWRGHRGEAIALGELDVAPGVKRDADRKLESFASGEGMRRRYAAITGLNIAGAREVLAAAGKGDEAATIVVESAGRALGAALAVVVYLLDPGAIILGGGIGPTAGRWRSAVNDEFRKRLGRRPAPPPIHRAALGAMAGVVGAAAAYRIRASEAS